MPPEAPALPDEPAPLDPPALPALPLEPPELPELPVAPPALELLEPAPPPPALELLAPELPLLELDPLAPPPLGDEAPELEEGEGGVGTEGVVGVLAEGQPASINNTPTKPSASRGRSLWGAQEKDAYVIGVAVPFGRCSEIRDQKTILWYQSRQVLQPHIAA